jgi:hypothetical protein
LKLLEVNLLETALYATSWVLLTMSSFEALEKVCYGVLTGLGIAFGKWAWEKVQKKYGL